MFNDWLTIGPFTIHGYGVMIGIGILAAFYVSERQAKKVGMSPDEASNLIFICLITGFLGSKITYILTNLQAFLQNPASFLSSDGWVVWGGIIGGIIGGWIWCKIRKLDFMAYFNLMIPVVALAQGFGRIGCFLAGCCYGRPTDSCIGVVFPAGSMAPAGIALLPTQLFSAAGDLLITAVLLLLDRKKHARGMLLVWYLLLYGAGRFIIEFFRDAPRGAVGALSTSQFISLFSLAAAAAVALLIKKRSRNDET
jgi:phosphatidylglycerol:prolipoprotein diacylglycerol transferase